MELFKEKRVFIDSLFLASVKVFQLIFPLIIYPILFTKLGTDNFGKIIFHLLIIEIVNVITSYGYELSGLKNCSLYRDNSKKLSLEYFTIQLARLVIFLPVILILYLIILPVLELDFYMLLTLSPYIILNQLVFPWFFLSIERSKLIPFIMISGKIGLLLIVLFFLQDETDSYVYLLALNFEWIIISIFYFYFLSKTRLIKFVYVPLFVIKESLIENFGLFVSRFFVIIYYRCNGIILGSLSSFSALSAYNIGEKMASSIKIPTSSFSQVCFAKISNERETILVEQFSLVILVLSLILVVPIQMYMDNILHYFDSDLVIYSEQLCLMLWAVPIGAVSSFLGASGLLAFEQKKQFNFSIYFSVVVYFSSLLLLYLFFEINILNLIFLLLFIESIILIIRIYFYLRNVRSVES